LNATVHLANLGAQLLFGALPVAAKLVLREMSPGLLVVVRVVGAAAVFAAVHALRVREPWPPGRDAARLALYSLLGVTANQWLYLEGLARTTALNAQLIVTSIPALTVAAAVALRREAASRAKIAGVAVAGAGALWLIGVERFDVRALGNALVLANSTCYALYLVLARDLLVRMRPAAFATWLFLFASVSLTPLAARELAAAGGWPALSGTASAALAFCVLGPTVGSYFLSVWALRRARSSLVAVYVYVQPLVAGALAARWLGEPVAPRTGPAALCIFAGVALVARAEAAERRALVAPPAGS
jgi:drug/metabolite transporter (DMT)-like permease